MKILHFKCPGEHVFDITEKLLWKRETSLVNNIKGYTIIRPQGPSLYTAVHRLQGPDKQRDCGDGKHFLSDATFIQTHNVKKSTY